MTFTVASLLQQTLPNGECLEWQGQIDRYGYGRVKGARSQGLSDLAHRAVYQLAYGAMPEGLETDHLCRNRRCINPEHLEAVTRRENQMRSPIAFVALNARKTHCPKGHPYDEANTYVYHEHGQTRRCCRACNRYAGYRGRAS